MKEKDPLEKFIDEVTNLLEITKKNQDKEGNTTPEIEATLEALERCADVFIHVQKDAFKNLGVTEKQLQELVNSPETLPSPQQQALEKLQTLKNEVEVIQSHLKNEADEKGTSQNLKKTKPTKGRKKKFRPLGSRNEWKPL